MLGKDVPAAWLPASTRPAVARLARLAGPVRDRAALALAARLAAATCPSSPIGTQEFGTLAGARLGCRVWNGVDPGLDLAALCLKKP